MDLDSTARTGSQTALGCTGLCRLRLGYYVTPSSPLLTPLMVPDLLGIPVVPDMFLQFDELPLDLGIEAGFVLLSKLSLAVVQFFLVFCLTPLITLQSHFRSVIFDSQARLTGFLDLHHLDEVVQRQPTDLH